MDRKPFAKNLKEISINYDLLLTAKQITNKKANVEIDSIVHKKSWVYVCVIHADILYVGSTTRGITRLREHLKGQSSLGRYLKRYDVNINYLHFYIFICDDALRVREHETELALDPFVSTIPEKRSYHGMKEFPPTEWRENPPDTLKYAVDTAIMKTLRKTSGWTVDKISKLYNIDSTYVYYITDLDTEDGA